MKISVTINYNDKNGPLSTVENFSSKEAAKEWIENVGSDFELKEAEMKSLEIPPEETD